MCGACGILGGGPDWVDRVDDAALANGQSRPGRMAERQRRISLVNLLLSQTGLRLSDAGGRLTLRGATGREEIVTSLAHVWIAADRIASRRLDILDDDTIAAIAREWSRIWMRIGHWRSITPCNQHKTWGALAGSGWMTAAEDEVRKVGHVGQAGMAGLAPAEARGRK